MAGEVWSRCCAYCFSQWNDWWKNHLDWPKIVFHFYQQQNKGKRKKKNFLFKSTYVCACLFFNSLLINSGKLEKKVFKKKMQTKPLFLKCFQCIIVSKLDINLQTTKISPVFSINCLQSFTNLWWQCLLCYLSWSYYLNFCNIFFSAMSPPQK